LGGSTLATLASADCEAGPGALESFDLHAAQTTSALAAMKTSRRFRDTVRDEYHGGQAKVTLPPLRDPVSDPRPVAMLDVQYADDHALAACVVAQDWPDAEPSHELVVRVKGVKAYRPGAFYERELPAQGVS
jgi:hypothetical protein